MALMRHDLPGKSGPESGKTFQDKKLISFAAEEPIVPLLIQPVQPGSFAGSRCAFRPAAIPVQAPATAIAAVRSNGTAQPPDNSCILPSNSGPIAAIR